MPPALTRSSNLPSAKLPTISDPKLVGIIGLGHVGFTSLVHYANAGKSIVGYDIDPKRVAEINNGSVKIPGIEKLLGGYSESISSERHDVATANPSVFWDRRPDAVLIAVPTERSGTPCSDFIASTFEEAVNFGHFQDTPVLFIIESTMTPGTTDSVIIPILERAGLQIGHDVYLAISPRRDWFGSGGRGIREMERVYGGVTTSCAEKSRNALSIVCDRLYEASGYKIAELTKCVENALRYVSISFVNQLTLAYPHLDITETLELASTKWNIDLYRPSLRVGGHCIPVAARYIQRGSKFPKVFSILDAALSTEEDMASLIAKGLSMSGCRNVLLLGYSYRGNLRVSTFSPAITLSKELYNHNIKSFISDPYYLIEEIKCDNDIYYIEVGDNIDFIDAVVLCADHNVFLTQDIYTWINSSKSLRYIIDNTRSWESYKWPSHIDYISLGKPHSMLQNISNDYI